jgi:hypothetical protein
MTNAFQRRRRRIIKHSEGNTMAEKGSPYYRNFPESQQYNINPTDSDSHAMLDSKTLTPYAIQIPSSM